MESPPVEIPARRDAVSNAGGPDRRAGRYRSARRTATLEGGGLVDQAIFALDDEALGAAALASPTRELVPSHDYPLPHQFSLVARDATEQEANALRRRDLACAVRSSHHRRTDVTTLA
jgi:hypothetical protein